MSEQNLVETTRTYYDSADADEFYHTIWGGEDIHVGLYEFEGESIYKASKRTVSTMAEKLPGITSATRVLDLGAGYGGAARYLAGEFGCRVECLNLSETENQRNKEKNKSAGLDDLISVVHGNFEQIPFGDNEYDVVWSEDAFLHSDNKPAIFREVARVLKPGGHLIFTDPMQADDCPTEALTPILQRIHLKEMGSVKLYKQLAAENNLKEAGIFEMPHQLTNHYQAVLDELIRKEKELSAVCSQEYITNMKKGLKHWIDGGKKGYLNWGILVFRKA